MEVLNFTSVHDCEIVAVFDLYIEEWENPIISNVKYLRKNDEISLCFPFESHQEFNTLIQEKTIRFFCIKVFTLIQEYLEEKKPSDAQLLKFIKNSGVLDYGNFKVQRN